MFPFRFDWNEKGFENEFEFYKKSIVEERINLTKLNNKLLKKRIEKMNGHTIICGYGRNGRQAAIELKSLGKQFVIIENDESVIEQIRTQTNYLFVKGNAVHEDILEKVGIRDASALITTLPNDADNLFIVLSAREMNPKLRIISRASEEHSDTKLRKAGADNVIMPDKIGGQRMAKLVAQADIVEFIEGVMLQDHDDVNLEEVDCDKLTYFVPGKTIGELGIRNKSGANVIGIKKTNGEYVYNPSSSYRLEQKDKIFVLGTNDQVESFKKLLENK
jgi:voltage-gated potassium channel